MDSLSPNRSRVVVVRTLSSLRAPSPMSPLVLLAASFTGFVLPKTGSSHQSLMGFRDDSTSSFCVSLRFRFRSRSSTRGRRRRRQTGSVAGLARLADDHRRHEVDQDSDAGLRPPGRAVMTTSQSRFSLVNDALSASGSVKSTTDSIASGFATRLSLRDGHRRRGLVQVHGAQPQSGRCIGSLLRSSLRIRATALTDTDQRGAGLPRGRQSGHGFVGF